MEILGYVTVGLVGIVVGVALDNKAHGAVMAVVAELKNLGEVAEAALIHLRKKA